MSHLILQFTYYKKAYTKTGVSENYTIETNLRLVVETPDLITGLYGLYYIHYIFLIYLSQ